MPVPTRGLEQGDKAQAPRRLRGLPTAREQGKAPVFEDGTALVAQAEKQRAMREGGASDAGGLIRNAEWDDRAERHGAGLANREPAPRKARPIQSFPGSASRIRDAEKPKGGSEFDRR